MADLLVLEFASGVGPEQYAAVNEQLGLGDGAEGWPEHMSYHVAGESGGKFVVVEVWDSQADEEEFLHNRLMPAFQAVGVPQPSRVEWLSLVGEHRG